MPDSTSALINQLANPPNPMENLGKTVQTLDALKQFEANKAVANAYQQSVDATGAFDQAQFNALASQGPGAWKFGETMRSAGAGLGAQATGTSADISAKLQQLDVQQAYMTPLMQRILNKETVTGADVAKELNNIPPGIITPQSRANLDKQLAQIGPDGDAKGLIMGGYFATQHGQNMLRQIQPSYLPTGGEYTPVSPLTPRNVPMTATPGEQIEGDRFLNSPVPNGWLHPDTHEQRQGTLRDYYVDHGVNPDTVQPSLGRLTPRPDGTLMLPPIAGAPAVTATVPPTAPPARGGGGPAVPRSEEPTGRPPQTLRPAQANVGGKTVPPQSVRAAGEQTYNDAVADLPASQQRVTTITNALQALAGATTGPAGKLQQLNRVLGTYAPEFIRRIIPGYDPEKAATDYDLAAKYMQQIANATSVGGGATTNDKLAAAISANPNVHMTQLAAEDVLHVLMSQERLGQYITKQAQAQDIAPADYAKFKANWFATHDPRAALPLTPELSDYVRKNLKGNELQTFRRTLEELDRNGF